jgi:sterol 3beta-glucosyltransferase
MNSRTTVTILTMGSRGDVQPYVAIGRGLGAAGYAVRIATLKPFRDFIRSYGLDFCAIPDPLASPEQSDEWKKWQSSDAAFWDKLRALRAILRQARPALVRNLDACVEACRGSHLILSSFTGFPGAPVAKLLGIPHVWALLQPCTLTSHHPTFLSPWQRFDSRLFNLGSHYVADVGFRWLFGPAIRAWHRERLPGRGTADVSIAGKRGPVLYGFSPHLVSRPADWGPDIHITGDWRLDTANSWIPPDQLVDFLAAHQSTVCICHTAITGWPCTHEALDLLLEAVQASGYPAVILSRLSKNPVETISDSCLLADEVPLEWLLPRVRLIVHHGGAGTSSLALRAGRPSIVMPSCFDQHFWAHCLVRLGAASHSLAPHRVTANVLAAAIREAIANEQYAASAECYAEKVRDEDGVRSAVEMLESYVSKSMRKTGGHDGKGFWDSHS